MAALDNLVVTTALPVIRASFNANLAELEWIVNAYTLTFAVLLLTGAALGDRFGRKRLFIIGLAIFTGGSAIAALSSDVTHADRRPGHPGPRRRDHHAAQPDDPVGRRARASDARVALGAWGGIAGLAIAIGPLVGGAIAEGLAWQWIFWLNVPIGLIAIPMASARLTETHGPSTRLDLPGLGLASGGLLAVVWGLVRANELGWTSPTIVGSFAVGARPPRRLRRLGGTERRADAPPPPLPLADVHRPRTSSRC